MANEKELPIFEEADKYRDYFKDDESALQNLVERLEKLQNISDQQITTIASAAQGRGTQHYLIEHITNAIAIQSQLQSVLKDKRSIKEKSIDLALKTSRGEDSGDGNEILTSLQNLIKEQKRAAENTDKLETIILRNKKTDSELDDEIVKKLGL